MFLSIAARLSNKCVFIWFGHFYASALINEGIDVATVSSALGHSAISTTTSIYLHAFQDANARASEAIANVLDFSKKETPPPDPDGRERKIHLIKTSCGQKASSGQ